MDVITSGLPIGSIYGLIAIGLALVYRPMRFINLAHGEFVVFAAYGAYVASTVSSSAVAVVLGALGAGLAVAIVAQVLLFRPMRGRDHLFTLIATVAAGLIIQELLRIFVNSGLPVALPASIRGSFQLPFLSGFRGLWLVIAAILTAGALHAWLSGRWGGLSLRALGDSMEVSTAFGINPTRTEFISVMLAGIAAGVAGLGLATIFRFLTPFVGIMLFFKGVAVVLTIGFRNVFFLLLGGMALGLLEATSSIYVSSTYRDVISFAVIIAIFLVRPRGLAERPADYRAV